jgi:hypothetical protein
VVSHQCFPARAGSTVAPTVICCWPLYLPLLPEELAAARRGLQPLGPGRPTCQSTADSALSNAVQRPVRPASVDVARMAMPRS